MSPICPLQLLGPSLRAARNSPQVPPTAPTFLRRDLGSPRRGSSDFTGHPLWTCPVSLLRGNRSRPRPGYLYASCSFPLGLPNQYGSWAEWDRRAGMHSPSLVVLTTVHDFMPSTERSANDRLLGAAARCIPVCDGPAACYKHHDDCSRKQYCSIPLMRDVTDTL